MEVKLLTEEKGELKKEGNRYTIQYNPLTFKQNSTIEIEISGVIGTDFSARAGCQSCTTVKTKKVDDNVILTITYDTKNIGNFNKTITFSHQGQPTLFNIKGIVTR